MSEDFSSSKPWVVLVGGFLGSGKTTLLLAAAKELEARGLRSALILNDQGDTLVDTAHARLNNLKSGEVTGGCFCCRFSELVAVIDSLRDHAPHVIFAEPVGSCTDISATILHPLQEYSPFYHLAPFTVLVDPARAEALLRSDADQNLAFLLEMQLKEADLVCFTKADLRQDLPSIAASAVRQISARTGEGVAAWLDEVLLGGISAGARMLDIDYGRYALAEAALAWLNVQVRVCPRIPVSPAMMLGPLFDRLDSDLTFMGITIVHLKAIVQAETGYVKAAACANGQDPEVEGMLDASPAHSHELLLNLRCVGQANVVQEVVERNLNQMEAELTGLRIHCFHPAAPQPERRACRAGSAQ